MDAIEYEKLVKLESDYCRIERIFYNFTYRAHYLLESDYCRIESYKHIIMHFNKSNR